MENIEEALRVNLSSKLYTILDKIKESDKAKISKKDFTNIHAGIDIVDVANTHINYATFVIFKSKIETDDIQCANSKKHITNLCKVFGLNLLINNCMGCYECGYFQSTQESFSSLILGAIKKINLEIRPQAINIVESIGVRDQWITSAIGNSYGDIHETHLEWAKTSRLNKTKAGDAIPDGYMEYIMPILKAKM